MTTLQAGEDLAAAGAIAPRVSLSDIEANIAYQVTFLASDAIGVLIDQQANRDALIVGNTLQDLPPSLELLTICLLVTRNGFTIIGKSAPASADNFDAEKGRQFALDDAKRQLWPLMGYELRERLHRGEQPYPPDFLLSPEEREKKGTNAAEAAKNQVGCASSLGYGADPEYRRVRALELAMGAPAGIRAETLIERAADFEKFLRGDTATPETR